MHFRCIPPCIDDCTTFHNLVTLHIDMSTVEQYYPMNIGDQYQCTSIPELIQQDTQSDTNTVDYSGTLQYSYHQYCQSNSTTTNTTSDRKLDDYLATVYRLFHYEPAHYDESNALTLLHGCNYDIKSCKSILKPIKYVDADESNTDLINLTADDICSVCTDGGDMILCDYKACHKVYHPGCVKLEKVPDGRWECAYHKCTVCQCMNNDDISYYCTYCPTSYCNQHVDLELINKMHSIGFYEYCCIECSNKFITQYYTDTHKYNAKRLFIKRVINILKREGKRVLKIPRVNYNELDLYMLYIYVIQHHGITAVNTNKSMNDIAIQLKLINNKTDIEYQQHVVSLLYQHYMNILYLYEKTYYNGWNECGSELDTIRLQYDRDDDGNLVLDELQTKHALSQPVVNLSIRDDIPYNCVAPFVQRPKIKRYKSNIHTNDNNTYSTVQPNKPLLHQGQMIDHINDNTTFTTTQSSARRASVSKRRAMSSSGGMLVNTQKKSKQKSMNIVVK